MNTRVTLNDFKKISVYNKIIKNNKFFRFFGAWRKSSLTMLAFKDMMTEIFSNENLKNTENR